MSIAPSSLESVPVFPLPETVLFPEARLPLHIFEPRYRTMLADCLASASPLVIASALGGGRIGGVGGLGRIFEHHPHPDGRSNILVVGTERVRLERILVEEPPRYPYLRAHVTPLTTEDVDVSETDRRALIATATLFAAELRKHDPTFTFRVPTELLGGPLADACAFHLLVDGRIRQALLEELDPRRRVRMVLDQLAIQHGAMQSDSRVKVLH